MLWIIKPLPLGNVRPCSLAIFFVSDSVSLGRKNYQKKETWGQVLQHQNINHLASLSSGCLVPQTRTEGQPGIPS